MKRFLIIIGLFVLPFLANAESGTKLILLGEKEGIPFDEVKATYIGYTVNALLQSCTVTTKIDSIPPVTYKGVRVTQPDGKVIEAHIFPDSINSYMVKIYTRKNGRTELHGKYRNHAYQLISMLEVKI